MAELSHNFPICLVVRHHQSVQRVSMLKPRTDVASPSVNLLSWGEDQGKGEPYFLLPEFVSSIAEQTIAGLGK